MSDRATHQKQAKHNKKLAEKLSNTAYVDWAITCAFYSALHFVEAKIATIPDIQHTEIFYEQKKREQNMSTISVPMPAIHPFREMLIGRYIPSIREKYTHLRQCCRIARYLETTNDKTAYDYFDRSLVTTLISDLDTIEKNTSKK